MDFLGETNFPRSSKCVEETRYLPRYCDTLNISVKVLRVVNKRMMTLRMTAGFSKFRSD